MTIISARPSAPAASSAPPASTHLTSAERRAELESLRVLPARHPGRWVATAVVAVLLAMVVNSLVTNPHWDWAVVGKYLTWPSILSGVWGTIRLTVAAAAIGFGLGTVLALMRLSRSPLLQSVAWLYVWVFRSVPLILQLLLWYNLAYLYPTLSFGIPFGPSFTDVETGSIVGKFGAAILGLGLSQAAYSSEIVRAGILGVDQGQHEAAAALGIPRARQQCRIVLPQAMRTIVPTSVNEIIGLLKGTSVVYVLAYGELFYTVGVIYGRNLKVVALLLVAGIWYLVLTTVLTVAQFYLERYYARGALRTLPPTPLQKGRWTLLTAWAGITGRPVPASVPAGWSSGNRGGHLFRTARTPRPTEGSGL